MIYFRNDNNASTDELLHSRIRSTSSCTEVRSRILEGDSLSLRLSFEDSVQSIVFPNIVFGLLLLRELI
ncbi:hypothetical protein JZ751_000715 [Albula glossodonta]|uniref:Uncharacterized protein n=1 Tax=Albula glossodonta TaxID=121402 RepID=A0A8T2PWI1_9TELE|nr:hypothetical protein JZ751_000715 [Albula glossodonta]